MTPERLEYVRRHFSDILRKTYSETVATELLAYVDQLKRELAEARTRAEKAERERDNAVLVGEIQT